ncbi:hypothetical protein PTKU64_80430 [Paraburkholderia terrae]|uniref:Right-handed parallel beta-helix repeat-containing protein n=1 Tax=Paraburkholderia terrae TaxID=311230 RepID=A0ABM7UA13_9BURK|nr:DUF6519 domain-containing protein [Paraburkholderia terrae]BCZ84368.1 hypothetical protein PTKU64_80430 [Paraburkholderia terrae]
MKADRSRDTFDPHKHYRRVLHQQGRVVLDADENEQVSIDLANAERTMSDVIGPVGVPETSLAPGYAGGFALGIGVPAGSSSSGSFSSISSFGSLSSVSSLSSVGSSSSSGSGSSVGGSSSSRSSGLVPLPGNDLTIAHGRIYVDGILVVNDADTTLLKQPYLPLAGDAGPTGLAGAGVYAAYLDVWERVVTPIDDPSIQEIALGGPDTCLRSQLVWQVRLAPIDTRKVGKAPVCNDIGPPWPQRSTGQLSALTSAPAVDPTPCTLPPESGYRSLENQLYRVEIQRAGGYGSATFKWSRENASVVLAVVAPPDQPATGTLSGTTLYVASTGRDASLGVAPGDWVELIDDRTEFLDGRGELLQIATTSDAQMTVTLQNAPTRPLDLSLHPKLRRWDQTQNATAAGVAIVDGTPVDLENGVQVQFSNGQYAVGDYWLIPARTATAQQLTGTIEWPEDAGGNPLPQPPRGVVHHYCKLGIVAYDGLVFVPPQGASAITDCRLFFPPLTGLETSQCPCTITLQPGSNWTAQLASLFSRNGAADAEICFAAGEFDTTQTATITTTGNVKVTGAGFGTKLIGQKLEVVLSFKNCASVTLRDLSVTASRATTQLDGIGDSIGGALEFDDCAFVNVDAASLTCAGALRAGAACLKVSNTIAGAGTVRVSNTRMSVGQMQYGMVLVNVQKAFIDRNELLGAHTKPVLFQTALQSGLYRKLVQRVLVGSAGTPGAGSSSSSSSPSLSPARPTAKKTIAAARKKAGKSTAKVAPETAAPAIAPADATGPAAPIVHPLVRLPNTHINVGAATISFNTPAQLKGVWQTYIDSNAPKEFASSRDLLTFVKQAASTLLTNPAAQAQFSGFRDIVRFFEKNQVSSGRAGIVVGGQVCTTLNVTRNTIDGFMQGVVVGLSHVDTAPGATPPDNAGSVTIRDNEIQVLVDPVLGYAAARYAIFVGNCTSLQIENNRASLTIPAQTDLATDGIRVWGYAGKKMIIRHNHITHFRTGIRVVRVIAPGKENGQAGPGPQDYISKEPPRQLWLVADNLLEDVMTSVHAPTCMQVDNVHG